MIIYLDIINNQLFCFQIFLILYIINYRVFLPFNLLICFAVITSMKTIDVYLINYFISFSHN